jgi:hypothetical protein
MLVSKAMHTSQPDLMENEHFPCHLQLPALPALVPLPLPQLAVTDMVLNDVTNVKLIHTAVRHTTRSAFMSSSLPPDSSPGAARWLFDEARQIGGWQDKWPHSFRFDAVDAARKKIKNTKKKYKQ